jgi:hypothetical protein
VSDGLRVYMRHLRGANMCNREPRVWFKRQGFSWNDFLSHGIAASDLIATGDPLALIVVEVARKERTGVER